MKFIELNKVELLSGNSEPMLINPAHVSRVIKYGYGAMIMMGKDTVFAEESYEEIKALLMNARCVLLGACYY